MNIETKYSLGDKLYHISWHSKKIQETCPTCQAYGVISVNGEEFSCPKCYGNSYITQWLPQLWYIIDERLTIGLVRSEVCTTDRKTKYMAYKTGIGSGQVLHEEDLFLTKEEAQAECDKRNGKAE